MKNFKDDAMTTFYPGPSKIYPQIKDFMIEAYQSGILSANHRSLACMALVEKTVDLLKEKLNIPQNYSVYFVSSATECWEIIVQSLIRNGSFHIYNGEFGKKWSEYTEKNLKLHHPILPKSNTDDSFSLQTLIGGGFISLPFTEKKPNNLLHEVICLTHNETSNGTYLDNETLKNIRKTYIDSLIAVDATSSMAGINLVWETADIWFASVQKCFGLPAGLAIMVCSPKALEQAKFIQDRQYYNSMILLHENMLKFQTTHTPNVLNIFLLCKIMEMVENITDIDIKIRQRANDLYNFFNCNNFTTLPINQITYKNLHTTMDNIPICNINSTYSPTVLTITGQKEEIISFKVALENQNILLGNGYGQWKDTTLRIANFPAITDVEFELLKTALLKV